MELHEFWALRQNIWTPAWQFRRQRLLEKGPGSPRSAWESRDAGQALEAEACLRFLKLPGDKDSRASGKHPDPQVPALEIPLLPWDGAQGSAVGMGTQAILFTRKVWEIITNKPDWKPMLQPGQEVSKSSDLLQWDLHTCWAPSLPQGLGHKHSQNTCTTTQRPRELHAAVKDS